MQPILYARHQFPPAIIQHAVWLYLRFTLSYRDVEELLVERGLDVSYETVRRWVGKFGPAIARNLRQLRCRPSSRWHLDEMVVRIAGKQMYLWRAVDDEGEVLEVLIQSRRNRAAARKLIRKLLKKHGFAPTRITTDKLRSYGAAFKEIGLSAIHEQGVYQNNRAEVSHQPLRRRDAEVQIAGIRPALRLHACRHPQHLQPPAPSDFPPHPAHLPGAGQGRLECCGRCCVRVAKNSGLLRSGQVPVTMPHILFR
jgi:putative transposase